MLGPGIARTSSVPHDSDQFGGALAVDGGRMLVGSRGYSGISGGVHFMDEDGDNATFVTNPTPSPLDSFGNAVYLGSEGAIVGVWRDDAGGVNAGAAHSFDRAGNFRFSVNNPFPDVDDRFGLASAQVGTNLLITC